MAFYKADIANVELNTGKIYRAFIGNTIGKGDNKANRFGVRLFRDGEPVSAESATVTGLFVAPDGTRYVISETSYPGSTGAEGNVAYVQLPGICYAIDGQFTLAIKLTGGGVEGTMRIIDGMVSETGENGAVIPTSTIPTTEDIIAAYEEAVAVMGGSVRFDADQSLTSTQKTTARGNIEAAGIGQVVRVDADQSLTSTQKTTARENIGTVGSDDIAPQFSAATGYTVGQYVIHNNILYRFIADHDAGAWNSSHVESVTVGDELVKCITNLPDIRELNLGFRPGYIKPDTLEITTTGTAEHLISNVVHVPAMSLLYVPKISKSGNTTLLCECSSDGTPLFATLRGSATSSSNGEHVIVPVINESYFIFGGNTSMKEYMRYYIQKFTKDVVFDGNNFPCSNPAVLVYGSGPITPSGTVGGSMYEHTNNILLMKGMTIEFWDSGSGSNVALSKYDNYTSTIISTILMSDGKINHRQYTATETMYVRLSSRIYAPPDENSTVCPPDKFYDWKIYYKPLHDKVHEKSPLYHKKLTVMGDSLIHGNGLGNGCTWITNIGIKYGMTYTNLGINGNTVAQQSEEVTDNAMVNRTDTVPTDTDIFVLLGGANDKRLNVPIGEVGNTDKTTFIGAINTIIANVRTRCPKAKILLMTTYNRYASRNTFGFGDEDYANAMIAAGKSNLVPVFDNFHCSGVNFLDPVMDGWIDECVNRQQLVDGEVVYYSPTHHFSVEGYEWLTPIYEEYISSGTATPMMPVKDTASKEYIDELLENATSVVDVTGSNQYVEPHGKYTIVNGVVYFKIMFKNLANVTSGTGSTAVANLPTPSGSPIFFEVGGSPFAIGSRLTFDSVWKLYGKRAKDDFSLVWGNYVPNT